MKLTQNQLTAIVLTTIAIVALWWLFGQPTETEEPTVIDLVGTWNQVDTSGGVLIFGADGTGEINGNEVDSWAITGDYSLETVEGTITIVYAFGIDGDYLVVSGLPDGRNIGLYQKV